MNSVIKFLRLQLAVLLAMLCLSLTAFANLVDNPFFTGTATTATNWTVSTISLANNISAYNHPLTSNSVTIGASTIPGLARPAIPAAITAAGGTTEFYGGCNSASRNCLAFPFVTTTSSGAQQAINTVVGTTYKLNFWNFSSGLGSGTTTNKTETDVYWGNSIAYTDLNLVPFGWSLKSITLPAAAAAITNLTVVIQENPDFASVTFMEIQPIVLRLAKTNPPSFVVGVPANYTLTTTNISTTTSGATFQIQDQLPPNIQYNSAAAGAGVSSVSCAATGTVAAGQLVTCTVGVTGGIPPSGTGAITLNVTPQAASAGVAGINRASVQYNGGVVGIAASASMATIASPSTCTGTDTGSGAAPVFGLGCAVAASITPTAAQLTFTKSVTTICDPLNGTTNPKNIPKGIVRWTMTVANSGAASVDLTTVSDLLSANTTFDPNLITGAGGAASCNSATGTPEAPLPIGKGFKLSILGSTRPVAAYPKFFTTVTDADAASFGAGTVTVNYALGLPVEPGYTAGQLKPGESVVVYFNVTIN